MRVLALTTGVCWLLFGALATVSLAQRAAVQPEHHPWGRFRAGAWRQACVVTEKLDEKGAVTSTSCTETTTTLTKVDDAGVTLQIAVHLEVDGNRFGADPETAEQGFHGATGNGDLKIGEPKDGQVTIEGQTIPCKAFRLESSKPASKTVTTIYYSATVSPYVLKRESRTTDPEGKIVLSTTRVETKALQMRHRALGERRRGALVKAVHEHADGRIVTWAFTSEDVPGGIIWQNLTELDKKGRPVRRSDLELVQYGASAKPDRAGLLQRRRQRGGR